MLSRCLLALGLASLSVAGCGTPSLVPPPSAPATLQASSFRGTYLALTFEPSAEIAQAAFGLRGELGFVDLGNAIPPRDPSVYHVTVGYFNDLEPRQAQQLAEQFQRQGTDLTLDGYGIANQQAAYFTLQGLDEARHLMNDDQLRFSADDPHVTFGVNPGNPRDVHGVPKKALRPVGPFRIHAAYHLMQGEKTLW